MSLLVALSVVSSHFTSLRLTGNTTFELLEHLYRGPSVAGGTTQDVLCQKIEELLLLRDGERSRKWFPTKLRNFKVR